MKITAMCSCPRLGFMDFAGQSIAAFINNGITYRNLFGVFWEQSLSGGMKEAIEDNDYIITTQDADFYEMGLIHGQASQERLAQDGQSIENGDHQNLAGQSANH